MYSDPAVRESEIRNMSQVYTEINKNVFPELRRARFIAEVDYQNFSDAELEELAAKAIDVLDEEALLRVAANATKAERKAELYKIAADKFGSDRANFNLAVLSLNAGKTADAEKYLAKVKTSDADVVNAKGVCELQKGNVDAAAKLFKQAGNAEAKANLGIIELQKGNYAAAAKYFEGQTGHNAAVAFILNGEYDKAEKSITCSCPKSTYLRAIVAARKGNAAEVQKNLDSLNDAFKAKAAKDVEFAAYR